MHEEERQLARLRAQHRRRRGALRRQGIPEGAQGEDLGIGDGERVRGVPPPATVGGPLHALVRQSGWAGPLALVSLRRTWPDIVGDALAGRSEPATVRGTILVVRVTTSIWATEVKMQSRQLRGLVNTRATLTFEVTEINVVVGPLQYLHLTQREE